MIKDYYKLGPKAKQVFDQAHANHLKALGIVERTHYVKNKITSLKANHNEGIIEARFKNGELVKYTPQGTWY